MKKRLLSLLTALCLMLTMVPAAFAVDAEDVPVDDQIVAEVSEEVADPVEEPAAPVEDEPVEEAPAPVEEEPAEEPAEEEPVVEEPAEEPVEEPVAEEPVAEESIEEETEGWDGTTTEAIPSNGEISTAAQLAQLAEDVNNGKNASGTFTIVADIDLNGQNFTPIGTRSKPFKGTLTANELADGEYPTISNANINHGDSVRNVGVIGVIDGGTVENLNFSNITVVSTAEKSPSNFLDKEESTTGIVAGTLNSGTIRNVIVEDNCSVTGKLRTGGIAGDVNNTGKIEYCKNHATVNGEKEYTGGIAGAAHNAPTSAGAYGATISNCENYGSISGTSSVGGILGYADRAHIENCYNEGTISGTGNYGTAGIVGTNIYNIFRVIFNVKPTVASTISNCQNAGNVNASYAGGILGAYVSAPGDAQPDNLLNCTITNCSNSGTITGSSGKIGGIFGHQISYASGDASNNINNMGVVMNGCVNTGNPNNMSGSTVSISIGE